MATEMRDVDPRDVRVPGARRAGADPFKLHRQTKQFGASAVGMPPLLVYEASDGALLIYNGVTRATRVAELSPGTTVRVEIVGKRRRGHRGSPRIGDLIP